MVAITAGMMLAQPLAAGRTAGVHPGSIKTSTTPSIAPRTTCATGSNPEFVAYDSLTKWFYTTNAGNGTISVFKNTCTHAGTITLPVNADPRGIAYNPSTGYMYVADAALNQIYIIHKLTLVQTLTNGSFSTPFGIAYDPSSGFFGGGGVMVVTNSGNNTVTLIAQFSPTGSAFVWLTLPVGGAPVGVCFSPVYNALFVVNELTNNVTIFDGSFLSLKGSIAVGSAPFACAFDPSSLLTYVTNTGSNNVSVMDAYYVHYSVPVGSNPYGVAYDPLNQDMYVANYLSHNLTKISSLGVTHKVTLPSTATPIGLAFDASNNKMDVCYWNTATVVVVS